MSAFFIAVQYRLMTTSATYKEQRNQQDNHQPRNAHAPVRQFKQRRRFATCTQFFHAVRCHFRLIVTKLPQQLIAQRSDLRIRQ